MWRASCNDVLSRLTMFCQNQCSVSQDNRSDYASVAVLMFVVKYLDDSDSRMHGKPYLYLKMAWISYSHKMLYLNLSRIILNTQPLHINPAKRHVGCLAKCKLMSTSCLIRQLSLPLMSRCSDEPKMWRFRIQFGSIHTLTDGVCLALWLVGHIFIET